VTADTVNIRKESTVSSEVITQAKRNDVFQLLDEKVDADNRTWYLVEFDFGCKGWIPGWLCEKTDDWPRVRKSNKGSLLNPAIDEDIYVRALLLEEYTRESFEKAFGKNYTEEARYVYKKYKYPILRSTGKMNLHFLGLRNRCPERFIRTPSPEKHAISFLSRATNCLYSSNAASIIAFWSAGPTPATYCGNIRWVT